MAGAGIAVGGILLAGLCTFGGIIIGIIMGIIMVPVGIVLVVIGMASGWSEAFGDPSKKPVRREMNVYVIAKVIADKKAEPVIDPEFFDPAELRHLVKIQFPNGHKTEFETSPSVFNDIGEGMNGDIVYQGRWLNQFTFRPKDGHKNVGEDPFRAGKL